MATAVIETINGAVETSKYETLIVQSLTPSPPPPLVAVKEEFMVRPKWPIETRLKYIWNCFIFKVKGHIEQEVVLSSVAAVRRNHFMLQYKKQGTGPYEISEDSIRVLILEKTTKEDVNKEILRIVGAQKLYTEHSAVVTFFVDLSGRDKNTIVIAGDHVAWDGHSATNFLRDLLMEMCGIHENDTTDIEGAEYWKDYEKKLINENFKFNVYVLHLPQRKLVQMTRPFISNTVRVKLTNRDTLGFISKCREEKTTVTAALGSAVYFALRELYDKQGTNVQRMGIAEDLRPTLDCPTTAIGNYSGGFGFDLPCFDGPFWDQARTIKNEIDLGIKNRRSLIILASNSPTIATYGIDNYGSYDKEQVKHPQFVVTGMHYRMALPLPIPQPVFVCGTYDGRMSIAPLYPQFYPDEDMSKLVNRVKEIIIENIWN